MTLTRKTIEAAAFWHQDICLACGAVQDSPQAPDPEAPPSCEACSSPELIDATLAARLLEALDEGEGDAEVS